jgi:hypothetical protein
MHKTLSSNRSAAQKVSNKHENDAKTLISNQENAIQITGKYIPIRRAAI